MYIKEKKKKLYPLKRGSNEVIISAQIRFPYVDLLLVIFRTPHIISASNPV